MAIDRSSLPSTNSDHRPSSTGGSLQTGRGRWSPSVEQLFSLHCSLSRYGKRSSPTTPKVHQEALGGAAGQRSFDVASNPSVAIRLVGETSRSVGSPAETSART